MSGDEQPQQWPPKPKPCGADSPHAYGGTITGRHFIPAEPKPCPHVSDLARDVKKKGI